MKISNNILYIVLQTSTGKSARKRKSDRINSSSFLILSHKTANPTKRSFSQKVNVLRHWGVGDRKIIPESDRDDYWGE